MVEKTKSPGTGWKSFIEGISVAPEFDRDGRRDISDVGELLQKYAKHKKSYNYNSGILVYVDDIGSPWIIPLGGLSEKLKQEEGMSEREAEKFVGNVYTGLGELGYKSDERLYVPYGLHNRGWGDEKAREILNQKRRQAKSTQKIEPDLDRLPDLLKPQFGV